METGSKTKAAARMNRIAELNASFMQILEGINNIVQLSGSRITVRVWYCSKTKNNTDITENKVFESLVDISEEFDCSMTAIYNGHHVKQEGHYVDIRCWEKDVLGIMNTFKEKTGTSWIEAETV